MEETVFCKLMVSLKQILLEFILKVRTQNPLANVDQTDSEGQTALIWACEVGNTDAATILLERGANINHADNESMTALLSACEQRQTQTGEMLIERGADVNLASNDGWTALMFAAQSGHDDCVRALLEKGADVEANVRGITAADWVKRLGRAEVERLSSLLKAQEVVERIEGGHCVHDDMPREVARAVLSWLPEVRAFAAGRQAEPTMAADPGE